MKVRQLMGYAGIVLLAALAMLAAAARVAAQRPAEREHAANLASFRGMGIAARLNTTPEALAVAYERARQANPRLNRGQFIAANVLADNLGEDHSNITTQAMLSGLQGGRSIGQTLRSLGLSGTEVKAATQTADRQRKEAARRAAVRSRAEQEHVANVASFRESGIAAKLNTTPEALAAAYARARQTNPRLNRGQFIAANVVAHNVGSRHPNITTQAMLYGLQNGRSIGQTLQNLGLSASEAKAATRTADHQRKEAERSARAERRAADRRR